jgi:hypothetical protein
MVSIRRDLYVCGYRQFQRSPLAFLNFGQDKFLLQPFHNRLQHPACLPAISLPEPYTFDRPIKVFAGTRLNPLDDDSSKTVAFRFHGVIYRELQVVA